MTNCEGNTRDPAVSSRLADEDAARERLLLEMFDLSVKLTVAERLILVVLAMEADLATRECAPSEEHLCHLTGLSSRGLQAALGRLAKRGIEVRVPIRPGASGRGAYSCPGRPRTYRLPDTSV